MPRPSLSLALLAALLGCSSAPVDPGGAGDTTAVPDASAPDVAPAPFLLTSPAFADGGTLPALYTCDGSGVSPPLAWSGAPEGTFEVALLMTTLAPDGLKWNWVLYGIPAAATGLAEGGVVGTAGLTSDGPELAYAPPCSQGPGPKAYTFTLHALSAPPALSVPAAEVTGGVLGDAVAAITLAEAQVTVTYTRP
jgi:phosphatidylethanolamine-binding protein (PEBP) family uncharacterized protein